LIKKISDKDKKDWFNFINNNEKLDNKDLFDEKINKTRLEKSIDLHGYTLEEANKIIYKFILHCYKNNIKKIKVITGRGSRSKNKENPYQSKNLSILKYSVPEYIGSNNELQRVIKEINQSDIEDISKGSFNIFLKKFKE
tara:strand:+ start:92 stop:511 length:420 start_codon:yes stop_codon:yes gene_type:complete